MELELKCYIYVGEKKRKTKGSRMMSTKMKTRILSRQCIKPSRPTLPRLKTFKLSLLDQLSPDLYANLIFFYPIDVAIDGPNPTCKFSMKSQLLQKSLFQTLTRFYPIAGRLQDSTTIDCNDAGGFFVEARTETPLSDFLSSPDLNTVGHFIPTTDKETMKKSNGRSMLLVQFTMFGCGGTAVSVYLSHKIADLSTFVGFLQSWTAACRGATEPVIPELELGASLFPSREITGMSASVNTAAEKFAATRLVISESKVRRLKSRVATALEKDERFNPSRVEVVLALVWKCALSASCTKTGSFKPSVLFQAIDIRPRMDPPVPDYAVGNFVWPYVVRVEEEKDLELHELVKKMRKSFKEFSEKTNKFKEEGGFGAVKEFLKERGELLKKNKDAVVFKCTSSCKFPLYETDFGWGKPVWTSSVNRVANNTIALLNSRDGGIESIVTLDEQVMNIFQGHEELLEYAVFNPRVSACAPTHILSRI